MSDAAAISMTATGDTTEKIRGRIPKAAWGYVRGQYELAERTYEDIAREFHCTPSAVFYVVKQARDRAIDPTLDRPAGEEQDRNRTAVRRTLDSSKNDFQWASQKVRDVTTPKTPSQDEQMAAQASTWLSDENCKRLFDAASSTILGFSGFRETPDATRKQVVKDALHETRRALASLELKLEMMPLAPATAPAQNQNKPERLPELA